MSQLLADIYGQIDSKYNRSCIDFYDTEKMPRFTFACGLAEGSDTQAISTFVSSVKSRSDVEGHIQAIVPFSQQMHPSDDSLKPYCFEREIGEIENWEKTFERVDSFVAADGIFDPKKRELIHYGLDEAKPPATFDISPSREKLRTVRRRRGHRSQSALLLRQIDCLIAIVDPYDEDRAGGTVETMKEAQRQKLPVLFICLRGKEEEPSLVWLRNDDDIEEIRMAGGRRPCASDKNENAIDEMLSCLAGILANDSEFPVTKGSRAAATLRHPVPENVTLLKDLFEPPQGRSAWFKREAETIHERIYSFFESVFLCRVGGKKEHTTVGPVSDTIFTSATDSRAADSEGNSNTEPVLGPGLKPPMESKRVVIKSLNSHYTGRYRGSFLVNFLLVIFALAGSIVHEAFEDPSRLMDLTIYSFQAFCVGGILLNSFWANGEGKLFGGIIYLKGKFFGNSRKEATLDKSWNRKAIVTRYTMERMRSLRYLPLFGHTRPPSVTKSRSLSNDLETNAMDWLLWAWIREIDPFSEDMPGIVEKRSLSLSIGKKEIRMWRPGHVDALNLLINDWLIGQVEYHHKNAGRYEVISRNLSFGNVVFNTTAFGTLLFLVFLVYNRWNDESVSAIPLIIGAVLPTLASIFASVKFFTEAARLADRYKDMSSFLADKKKEFLELSECISHSGDKSELGPIGGHIQSVLQSLDLLAIDMIDEVSDWSVVYRKEVDE
ncbi:MAG: hypothetical protein ACPGN3_09730 [Opitutales bacterium]